MNAFLRRLSAHGVRVSARDGQLRVVAPKGALTDELRREVAARKSELLEALGEKGAPEDSMVGPRSGPPSWAQRRYWFLHQLAPQSTSYSLGLTVRLRGLLDTAALTQALTELVRRHEALRTTLEADAEGELVAVVHPPCSVELILGTLASAAGIPAALKAERARPMTPLSLPMLRAALFTLGDYDHVLSIITHHFACDGWSFRLIPLELSALYRSFAGGEPAPPMPEAQHSDFAHWQREYLASGAAMNALEYFRGELAPPLPQLDLPTDRPRPPSFTTRGDGASFTLGADLSEELHAFSKREKTTAFAVLLAAWFATLARHTGERDLVVGVPVALRPFPEARSVVGALTNILPVRVKVSLRSSFRDHVAAVSEKLFAAFSHQDMPFDRILQEVSLTRDPSRMPVVETAFNMLNVEVGEVPFSPEITAEPLSVSTTTARFDVALDMCPTLEGYSGRFEYRTDLFDRPTVVAIAQRFVRVIELGIRSPDGALYGMKLTDVAKARLLSTSENADRGMHQLVFEAAARHPHAVAIEAANLETMTYQDLTEAAGRMAVTLFRRGVRRGDRVALVMDPSRSDFIVALLAVLGCGAAYVPIDISAPTARIREIVEDAAPTVTISEVPGLFTNATALHDLERELEPAEAFSVEPSDTAYVIYTSGTTGKPKGVVVTHGGGALMVREMVNSFRIAPGDRVAQFASAAFDVAVSEVFMALCAGATLCLLTKEERRPGVELIALLERREITIVSSTASVLSVLPRAELPALRLMIVGGETASRDVLEFWSHGRELWLAYGPTETTVTASHGRFEGEVRSIGRPLAHVDAHVLDDLLQPALPGVAGELYIGGHSLARGYLGRPGLTAAVFVPDPFGQAPGARMYRSGDRVKWGSENALVFVGREDDQVKVRGHRVELQDIDAALRMVPGVLDGAAVAIRDAFGALALRAYVQTESGVEDGVETEARVRRYLEDRLPPYMVPTSIEACTSLPKTESGKLDRRALEGREPPDSGGPALQGLLDEDERAIVRIWSGVLGAPPRARDVSFFESGGHSLLAVRMLSEIERTMGVRLPTATIYARPSLLGLVSAVRASRDSSAFDARILTLAQDGPEAPLFLVHGAEGLGLALRPLARAFEGQRPVHSFVATGFDPGETPFSTVEAMAEAYVERLLDAHQGHMIIGGWSFGGVVAAEMSSILCRRGKPPLRLLLIDSHLCDEADVEIIREAGVIRELFEAELRRLFPTGLPERLAHLAERAYSVFATNVAAAARHEPSPVEVPTTLIQAGASTRARQAETRWRALVSSELRRHTVEGDHHAIIRHEASTARIAFLLASDCGVSTRACEITEKE